MASSSTTSEGRRRNRTTDETELANSPTQLPPEFEEKCVPREYVAQSCPANCLITSALAVLLCRRKCDANRVIADFAFFPPSPPTYVAKKTGKEVRAIEWKYRDLERNPSFARFRIVDGRDGRPVCRLLQTARKQVIPSFYFEAALNLTTAGVCVIYFHANATDCGAMLPTYAALRARLGVSVLAVEYTGYGSSTGRPSVADTFADADAAYLEATQRRGFAPEKIVLYGQSVGSGPACHLAARRQCAGLVLHSPIASGIRSLTGGGCCSPIYVFSCLDPFHNLRELQSIECPVFVIHGTHDEEIPVAHGYMLHDAAKHKHDPFWVPGAGHNNVLETMEDLYFAKLHAFLQRLVCPRSYKSDTSLDTLGLTVSVENSSSPCGRRRDSDVPVVTSESDDPQSTPGCSSSQDEDDDKENQRPTKKKIKTSPHDLKVVVKKKKKSLFKGWWRRLKSAEEERAISSGL